MHATFIMTKLFSERTMSNHLQIRGNTVWRKSLAIPAALSAAILRRIVKRNFRREKERREERENARYCLVQGAGYNDVRVNALVRPRLRWQSSGAVLYPRIKLRKKKLRIPESIRGTSVRSTGIWLKLLFNLNFPDTIIINIQGSSGSPTSDCI